MCVVLLPQSTQIDEEVWLELQFYTDQNRLEDVMAKMQHDEIRPQLFREFMGLVIPGSGVIMGGFQPHQHLDFVYLSNE